MARIPVSFGSWATFKTSFNSHFIPADAELAAANAMYSTRMGSRPFNEWYQEWSVHAARAGVDEKTRMFAFRTNLPEALHNKLLGLSPQPTTMATLVEKTRLFDNTYHAYKQKLETLEMTHEARMLMQSLRKNDLPLLLTMPT